VPSAQVLPNRNQHIRSQPDDTPIKLEFSKRRLDEWTEVDFVSGSRGVRRLEDANLFFPEEMPDVIAEEARKLWNVN